MKLMSISSCAHIMRFNSVRMDGAARTRKEKYSLLYVRRIPSQSSEDKVNKDKVLFNV